MILYLAVCHYLLLGLLYKVSMNTVMITSFCQHSLRAFVSARSSDISYSFVWGKSRTWPWSWNSVCYANARRLWHRL